MRRGKFNLCMCFLECDVLLTKLLPQILQQVLPVPLLKDILSGWNHYSFPNTKIPKHNIQYVFHVDQTGYFPHSPRSIPQLLRTKYHVFYR